MEILSFTYNTAYGWDLQIFTPMNFNEKFTTLRLPCQPQTQDFINLRFIV
mgnify:CR=1 FL=1